MMGVAVASALEKVLLNVSGEKVLLKVSGRLELVNDDVVLSGALLLKLPELLLLIVALALAKLELLSIMKVGRMSVSSHILAQCL